jgi:hypothetical protein
VTPLTPNVPTAGTLSQADCPGQTQRNGPLTFFTLIDRYSFTAAAGQQVRLVVQVPETFGSNGIPLTLSLSDANGVLAQGPQITNFGAVLGTGYVPDTGSFALPRAGTYFVELASGNPFNYTLTAQLSPAGCDYAVSPPRLGVSGTNAAPGSFNVIAAPGCTWTATSNASWLTLTSVINGLVTGTGNGTVNFTVANNPDDVARTATIRLGDQTVTVEQSWQRRYVRARQSHCRTNLDGNVYEQ